MDDTLMYQSTNMTNTTTGSDGVNIAALIGGIVFFVIIYLITAFVLSRVFKKAGRPAWAAFVPVYNVWQLLEMGGQKGAWSLLLLASWIPVLGIIASIVVFVFQILASLEIAKRFGKSTVFAVFGLIIFSLVGYIILAFDKSTYQGAPAVAANTGFVGATPAPQAGTQPTQPQQPQTYGPQNGPNDNNQQPPTNVVQG